MTPKQTAEKILAAALADMGAQHREGQDRMCRSIATAIEERRHLIVQAGTGTGKSLGYLAPLVADARQGRRAIISTATIALQRQLMDKDIPVILRAAASNGGSAPAVALLKGWSNYVCVRRLGAGEESEDDTLFAAAEQAEPATSPLGREILAIREWAAQSLDGDRDNLPSDVSDRAWAHASISARECPGDSCPFAAECFPRRARKRAQEADIVVTNHALLGVDAMGTSRILGSYDTVVVDEAHELADRVRQAVTASVWGAHVSALAVRVRQATKQPVDDLAEAGDALAQALDRAPVGLLETLPSDVATSLSAIAHACARLISDIPQGKEASDGDRVSRTQLGELVAAIDATLNAGSVGQAVWISEGADDRRYLNAAPIDIGGHLANGLLPERSAIFTSATLALGGSFQPVAAQLGLPLADAGWDGIDVGSPFSYAKQGISYVAAHLPVPTRSGLSAEAAEELLALATASGGGMLGLFSSRRAVSEAAEALRESGLTVLVQGEGPLPALVERFRQERDSCLLGTLSLWQGVDVPGPSCRLVVIDRVPFPRPDDPLIEARCQAAKARNANPFMEVSLTHAALRLAQGAGRLIRSHDDHGVVAILDSRVETKRYGGFLQRTLPPMWPTRDRQVVLAALKRLSIGLTS